MKKVNFIPKTDIDEYLNDDFNKEIFFNLTESEDRKGIFEPLEFLNLLYEQVEIIKANKEKPSAVVKHLLGLELDKTKLYYLLLCLEVRIIKASNIAYGDNETYFKLTTCVDFIKRERKKLEAKLHTIPDGFENNLEEYLKELYSFQINEPEKYENFKEIFDSIKNISLSKYIEYIEFLFEKSKRDYSGLTVSIARKEIFIREQLEIYEKANLRFKKFGDYTNNTFNKYQPIFTEALEYWKAELDNLKPSVTALLPQPIVKQKPKLTINQIALKYVYELLQITRENSKEIARKYGHNSGEKLFQRFTYYSSTANRKGKPIPCTPKKLDNKIKLIESVIELLPTDKQERAKDEVSILKEIYEAEYQ